MQVRPYVFLGPPRRHPIAQTASITETSTVNPIMAIFSAGVVLTTAALNATTGASPALTIDLRLGCSVMNSAIGGLIL